MCPRPTGNALYNDDDFINLPPEGPAEFTIDREGDEGLLVADYICPNTLPEMMIIVHDIRSQLAAHAPCVIQSITGRTDVCTFATPLSSSISSNVLMGTGAKSNKNRTNNYN